LLLQLPAVVANEQIDYSLIDFSSNDFEGCNNNDFEGPEGIFRYSSVRWTGEGGCIGGIYGPPTVSMWSSHLGNQKMSMPSITIGNDWNQFISDQSKVDLPARISDIEELRASFIFQIPNWDGQKHTRIEGFEPNIDQYRIYYQMALSVNPHDTKATEGDFCVNLYQTPTTVSDDWYAIEIFETEEYEGQSYLMTNQGPNCCGGGPFRTAILKPNPTPDVNGIVRTYNVDIKSILDYYCQQGRGYNSEHYLQKIHASMENFNLDGSMKFLDLAFYIKVKGKPGKLVPEWTTLGHTLEAGSALEGKHKLQTTSNGAGSISLSPAGTYFEPGTEVTLKAVPDPRNIFTGWSQGASGTDQTITLTINSDMAVTADFAADPSAPLIMNGDFTTGFDYWEYFQWHESGSAGTISSDQGSAVVNVTNGGSALWHQQVYQEDIPLKNGQNLTLSFDAKSNASRSMTVVIKYMNPDKVYLQQTVSLSPAMQTYTYNFTVDSEPLKKPRVEFNLGTEAGEVELDNVSLIDHNVTSIKRTASAAASAFSPVLTTSQNKILWTGLKSQPWEMEIFDLQGSALIRTAGYGTRAAVTLGSTIASQQVVFIKLTQGQTIATRFIQLMR